jgi:hypothetical protein
MAEGSTLAFLSPTSGPAPFPFFVHASAVSTLVDLPGCSPEVLGCQVFRVKWLSYLSQQDKEEKNKAAATRPRALDPGRTPGLGCRRRGGHPLLRELDDGQEVRRIHSA